MTNRLPLGAWVLLCCLGLLPGVAGAQVSDRDLTKDNAAKLAKVVTIKAAVEGKTLEEILTHLAKEYDCDFEVDLAAFERQGLKDVLDHKLDLPAQENVTLEDLLNAFLRPINGHARPGWDAIEIRPAENNATRKK